MWINLFGSALIALLALTATTSASLPLGYQQSTPNTNASDELSGEWSATFKVESSTVPGTFKFTQKNGEVTGTVESEHTGPGTLSDGKWRDNTLTCTLKFARHESIDINGTLKKDGTLAGEFRTEGMQGTWEATRTAPKTPAGLR